MIPQIVHQTWKTEQFDYWVFKKSQAAVREHFPDWNYSFWTDDSLASLIRNTYPGFCEPWSALNAPIKRVDVARYFLMHCFGGIYADLDFIFTQPLDDLIDTSHRIYFYRSQQAIKKGWRFLGNAFMMSAPGESFWLELASHLLSLPPETPVLDHTGPRAVGAFFESLPDKSAIRVFGPDLFDNDRCDDGVGEHRYGYHMRAATWQHPGFEA